MKNKYFYAGLLILLIIGMSLVYVNLASAQTTANSCNPTFKIVSQDPIPATPDSYAKVVIEASNLNYCNGLSVDLTPSYPFSLDPEVNPIQILNSNPYAPDYKQVWDIPYQIRVASDALEGDYNLALLWHSGASDSFASSLGANLNISIQDVQTSFATVIQAISGNQISIGIVNTGKNTANSLIVSIPQQQSFMASGTSQQIVGNLAAGDYTLVSFTIVPSRGFSGLRNNTNNAQVQVQNPNNLSLNVQLDYTDGIGKRRTVLNQIPAANLISSASSSGNFTRTGNGTFSRTTTTTTSTSVWVYVLIIAVVLIAVYFIYKKREDIAGFLRKGSSSKHAPDWVESERKKK